MKKLAKGEGPGEIIYQPKGRKEIRYSYRLKNKLVFTFGLTRSSTAKSKEFPYVYRQMEITKSEYQNLFLCPWQKKDYNKKLIDSGKI